jgi:hypothetical protein
MTIILIRTPSTIILVHDKIYVASVLKCIGRLDRDGDFGRIHSDTSYRLDA